MRPSRLGVEASRIEALTAEVSGLRDHSTRSGGGRPPPASTERRRPVGSRARHDGAGGQCQVRTGAASMFRTLSDETEPHAMISHRKSLAAAAAVASALAFGAPAASASTALPTRFSMPTASAWWSARPLSATPYLGTSSSTLIPGPCGSASDTPGQGATAGTASQVCMGSGLSFVGPAIGQIATVIGPTIISPGFVGNVVVSAGNGSIGG
jgi:hypothetical protein